MADIIRFQRIIEEHYTNLVNKLDIYTETILSQNNGLSEERKTNLNNSRQKIFDKINSVKSANLANLQETNSKSRIESLEDEKNINSIIFSNGYLLEHELSIENLRVPCFINWNCFLDGVRLKPYHSFDDHRMFYEHILDCCLLENVFSKQKERKNSQDLETTIIFFDFTDESFLNEIHSLKLDRYFCGDSGFLKINYYEKKLGLKNLNSLCFVNFEFDDFLNRERQLMNITELIFENCVFNDEHCFFGLKHLKSLTFNYCNIKDMKFIRNSRNLTNLKIKNPRLFNNFLESTYSTKNKFDKSMKNDYSKYYSYNDILFQISRDLNELVLTGCKLIEIGRYRFTGFNNLIELRLSNNSIDEIADYSFEDLKFLKQLFLDNNEISTITRNTFKGLKQLIFIDLSNNPLVFIDDEAFSDSKEVVIQK